VSSQRILRSVFRSLPLSSLADVYDKSSSESGRGSAMFKRFLLGQAGAWAAIPLLLGVAAFASRDTRSTEKQARPAVATNSVGGASRGLQAAALAPAHSRPTQPALQGLGESRGSATGTLGLSVPSTQDTKAAVPGLSYETYIPRPTKKGYYEPKVVPYPVGKPVFVQGYYRSSGTYVAPHFRSLPRR
jgi:hypothetical protein